MPNTAIVPAPCRTTWAPGIRMPVPVRPVYTTLVPPPPGVEASALIQAAITGCPEGATVQLFSGTFQCNDHILLHKGITLRGSGAGQTVLRKTNGAIPNKVTGDGYICEEYEPVVILGPSRWPKLDDRTSTPLTVTGLPGALSVLVRDVAGFAPGQVVLLDQDDYAAAGWIALPDRNGTPTATRIWASDRIVFAKHDPPEPNDDPFPDSLAWFSRPGRPLCELKEIAAVAGTTITFTTPLHAEYRTVCAAQLTRFMPDATPVQRAGLEDLSVVGGSDGNIQLSAAAYSWVKNVESTTWVGAAMNAYLAFRCELRDSFIHDGVWPYPGGGGYGISLSGGASEILIENNAIVGANHGAQGTGINKVLVVRSAGAGSVVAYNYLDNGSIGNFPTWVEVGANGSHMVGSHHLLFEGNQTNNYDSDDTHGNAWGMTIFRNHLVGSRRDFPGTQSNARCAGLMYGSWWHAFIGNVLGEAGQMDGWVYESTYPWPDRGVWKLGYAPSHWEQAADPTVLATLFRAGNFDYLTNIEHWDTLPQPIPDSLYLDAKPDFFGTLLWPWVTPDRSTKVGALPARVRYEAWAGTPLPPDPPEPTPEPEPRFCTDGSARYAGGEELLIETKQSQRVALIAEMTPQGWTLVQTEKAKGKLSLRFRCVG